MRLWRELHDPGRSARLSPSADEANENGARGRRFHAGAAKPGLRGPDDDQRKAEIVARVLLRTRALSLRVAVPITWPP